MIVFKCDWAGKTCKHGQRCARPALHTQSRAHTHTHTPLPLPHFEPYDLTKPQGSLLQQERVSSWSRWPAALGWVARLDRSAGYDKHRGTLGQVLRATNGSIQTNNEWFPRKTFIGFRGGRYSRQQALRSVCSYRYTWRPESLPDSISGTELPS